MERQRLALLRRLRERLRQLLCCCRGSRCRVRIRLLRRLLGRLLVVLTLLLLGHSVRARWYICRIFGLERDGGSFVVRLLPGMACLWRVARA